MAEPRTIGSLFAGIGGLELGLERAGLGPVIWQAESDPFCRRVLQKHWPGVKRYHDVREVDGGAEQPEIICGGFPCQDVSSAGKGAGLAGKRSGLWFEFSRVVGDIRPRWVIVENVASGARRWVDAVCAQLGQLGYEALPLPISAQDVGAPHIRRRVFVVAHAVGEQLRQQPERSCGQDREGAALAAQPGAGAAAASHGDPYGEGQPAEPLNAEVAGLRGVAGRASPWATAPEFRGMDDGLRHRVDRLRALGNAVVPQCAEVIGHAIVASLRPTPTIPEVPHD